MRARFSWTSGLSPRTWSSVDTRIQMPTGFRIRADLLGRIAAPCGRRPLVVALGLHLSNYKARLAPAHDGELMAQQRDFAFEDSIRLKAVQSSHERSPGSELVARAA